METPFSVAEARQLTNGVIDLLFASDAGWQVVDYKTDRSIEDGRLRGAVGGVPGGTAEARLLGAGASVVNVRTEMG